MASEIPDPRSLRPPAITVVTSRYSFRVAAADPPVNTRPQLARAADAEALLRDLIGSELSEVLVLLLLTTDHRLLGFTEVARGSLNIARLTVRDVFLPALLANAALLIVAHNHPNGVCRPSSDDRLMTLALREGAALVGIRLLDHLVIGEDGTFSFARAEAWRDLDDYDDDHPSGQSQRGAAPAAAGGEGGRGRCGQPAAPPRRPAPPATQATLGGSPAPP